MKPLLFDREGRARAETERRRNLRELADLRRELAELERQPANDVIWTDADELELEPRRVA